MANQTLSLRLLVDTVANKVLFAEAGKDFIDFLFYIMLLPIGTIIELLKMKDHKVHIGGLSDLYKSIEAFSSDYIQPNVTKDTVLKPISSMLVAPPNSPVLKDALAVGTKRFYLCNSYPSSHYVSDASGTPCPSCNSMLSREIAYVAPKSSKGDTASSSGGYVKGLVTYMVMDNLEVKPMSAISVATLINKLHVKDVGSLVEKHVNVGFDEGMRILKVALESRAVLTTAFLENDCLP